MIIKGDIDKNNIIDVKDLAILGGHLGYGYTMSPQQRIFADVVADGIIDDKDYDQIEKHINGIEAITEVFE